MNSLSASVFIGEDESPIVVTVNGAFETIHIGELVIFTNGGDTEAIDLWDRLRRACVEAADRAQRRIDAMPVEAQEAEAEA